MTLKSIFRKPIDRPIEGVIKADDEASLRLEIDEYVLTNEVQKRLEAFVDAYNNYEGANGVWISGFFGSGKSHLLKMLALLLENRDVNGASTLDLFLPKCGENEILRGDLKRAVAIPSKSVLFNIDQKADVISKTQIDALLAVFVKVFDEMCGYYGKQGHIAQFERDLASRDLYESFKSSYKALAGRSWETGREQALLESNNISKAYSQVTNTDESSAAGILDKYRNEYHVSIADFAKQVQAYVDRQSPDFRLNFFVDEVGQYIAENVKLMTNLQTIAESLATRCRGRAWVIVTSQNDMTTVLGEMNRQQSNDFSKIMARFANKMLLTSTNVAEVIQKRLLAKTDDGTELVSDLYHAQENNFGTLFRFTDGSREYKVYRDRDEFIRSYPFVPYQFELFQSAIENLSRHNAFEGRHSSVGERSMLGVFQQVAIHIRDYDIGQVATFDMMFEGIQTALKAQTQKAILAAERQLTDSFAIKVLKALFLVKYVKEFKPTVRNICVLMLGSFTQDLPQFRKKVEEALNLLEQQTYIQRTGDIYEYLTDEEKDVEEEIKNTEVETTDVAAELEKIVFDHVIKSRKIRYDDNGQDYPFSRKLDDRLHGREYELAINVVSPFHENSENESILQMQSMGRDELLVLMPPDERLVRDLLMYKRTEKYIRQNVSITQTDSIKRILDNKASQNRELYGELEQRAKSLLGRAKMFVAGGDIEISGEDAQTRIVRGFHDLISRAYPNLRMLRKVDYKEDNVRTILSSRQGTLDEVSQLSESEQEILAFIQSNSRGGVRTTLKNLIEKFERKPYGWYYAAILCTLASVCARGKVEVRADGNLLEDDELERALRNTHAHGNIVLDPQVEFTASQVRALKELYGDFFDTPPLASEAKALGKDTGIALQELVNDLRKIAVLSSHYPFANLLNPALKTLEQYTGKPYTWYLTEFIREKDGLLEMKENLIDPLRRFMSGPQRDIFDSARKLVEAQEPNFTYVESEESSEITRALIDPECFKGNRMQQIKAQVEALQKKIRAQINTEIFQTQDALGTLKDRLCGMSEFSELSKEQQSQITRPFDEFNIAIQQQTLIAVIRDNLRRFEETDYQRLLSQMSSWAQPASKTKPSSEDESKAAKEQGSKEEPPESELRIEYIPCRAVRVSFDKAWLADDADVERYLEAMREALMAEIRKGKRIQI